MRVEDVELYLVPARHAMEYTFREGLPALGGAREDLWLRVATDEGAEGWAHLDFFGREAFATLRATLPPAVIGRDPLLKEALWQSVWELDRIHELPIYALGVLDMALWDLTARLAGLPLYQVLGGQRERIPAYASTVTFPSVERYLDVADQCLAAGFRAIKLHAWGDVRRDAELARRLRAHVGDDVALLYDGSAAFTPDEALRLGRALEGEGFEWYEEPIRDFHLDANRRLAAALDIPLLATETSDGVHYTAAEFLRVGAADILRTGTYYKGGVTGSLRIAHVADAFGRKAEVHGGGLANRHLCMAIPNTTYYECLVTDPVVPEPGIGEDGWLVAPTGPGTGHVVDRDELRRAAVAVDDRSTR